MQSPSQVSILIADDDADDRDLVRDAFNECQVGCPLHFVHDGEDLMAYLTRRAPFTDAGQYPMPGLILLDLNMPRKDGLEVLEDIARYPHLRQIPVVILTTSSEAEDVTASYQAGVNSFITKPASYDGLLNVVRTLEKYWLGIVELPENMGIHD